MKIASYLASFVLIALGALWILQGTDLLKFGAMAGQTKWAIYGAVLAVVGILLLVWTRRGRKTP